MSGHRSHLEGELKLRWSGSSPGEPDSTDVEGEFKLCMSNKFSGDDDVAGLETIS